MKPVLFLLMPVCFWMMPVSGGHCQSQKITDFARDIAPILRGNCNSCHSGDNAKNGFVVLDRDAFLGFVEPGSVVESSIWTDYLVQPTKHKKRDSLVMPPDGPLQASELALIRLWIEEGAQWSVVPQSVAESSPSFLRRVFLAFGYFHPALVHFPIALFLVGGFCAFLSYFLGPKCQSTAFQSLVLAMLASVVTVIMGWGFAENKGYPAWNKMLSYNATHHEINFFYHRWLGTLTALLGIACVVAGLIARRNKSSSWNHGWRIGAMLLAVLVALVGHQGGELIYGDIFEKAIERLLR
ncbi:MAG: hypothetical protein NTY15_11995 [Planctomycetota bacterium]|nr:hypothetical protein [Planctomycetota bacterium]